MFNNNYDGDKLNSQILDLTIKTNSCYCKLNELIHRLNEIESKINIILTKNLVNLPRELNNLSREFNNLSSKQISLISYKITFVPECNGFLDIECEKCEIIVNAIAHIFVKDYFKNFYVEKYNVIDIKNLVNLKNISFRQAGK